MGVGGDITGVDSDDKATLGCIATAPKEAQEIGVGWSKIKGGVTGPGTGDSVAEMESAVQR